MFLILGMFLNSSTILVLTIPIVKPLITMLGIDPVHFGIVMTFNVMIGMLTPPLGVCLYIAADIAEAPFERVIRAVLIPGLHRKNDLDQGKAALEAALANGVCTIHSSHEYGTRYALGEVLSRHKGSTRLKHIIKATVPDYDDDRFIPEKFREMVETALRELYAERIDIVQHLQRVVDKAIIYDERGDPARIAAMPTVNAALRDTFETLKEEGKVGYLCTFPHTPGFAKTAIESGAFDGMVAFFNLVETELYPFLDDMRERGMGMFSMRPFREGLLTDKRKDRTKLPEGDPHLAETSDLAYRRFEALQRELGSVVGSWTDLAIKFSLAHPLFCSVIVSMNTPAQVESVLAAADGNYPDAAFVGRVHAVNTAA